MLIFGTAGWRTRFVLMSDDAKRFRDRARDCLNLAIGARTETDRTMLEDIAAELEAEARKIDADQRSTPTNDNGPTVAD